jgi:predicted amidohydrolase
LAFNYFLPIFFFFSMRVALLFLFVALAESSATESTVALVDFAPVAIANGYLNYTKAEAWQKVLSPNLNAMAALVAQATADPSVRLVVFPEDGLYGPDFPTQESVLPFLEEIPTPSDKSSYGPIVSFVSNLAMQHQVYIVLDMGELVLQLGSNETRQYNTAIAMAPSGVLASVYHKQHLYYEPQFDAGPTTDPSAGVFEMSLPEGTVKLGLCVCFDALFPNVWKRMMEQVDFMVAPTWWVNLPPLGISTGMHSGVARAINRTVLVAGVGLNWLNSGTLAAAPDGTVLAQHFNPSLDKPASVIIKAPLTLSAGTPPPPPPPPPVEANYSSVASTGCSLCTYLVTQLDELPDGSFTYNQVKTFVNESCSKMPPAVRKECEAFIQEEGEDIITLMILHRHRYPVRTFCDTLGLCGLTEFEAAQHTSGVVGSSDACVAKYSFGESVQDGERFGLLNFVGPYAPDAGEAIYNLSSCAVVRCSSAKRFRCASVFTEGGPVDSASVFESLSVTYRPNLAKYPRTPMSWITNGNYTVIPQATGVFSNGTNTIGITAPTTISSAAFWILIPV